MPTIFMTPTKIEYEIQKDGATGLIKFSPVAGGAIPNLLDSWYTSQRFADAAWKTYVDSLTASKPDMRLKENKPQGTKEN